MSSTFSTTLSRELFLSLCYGSKKIESEFMEWQCYLFFSGVSSIGYFIRLPFPEPVQTYMQGDTSMSTSDFAAFFLESQRTLPPMSINKEIETNISCAFKYKNLKLEVFSTTKKSSFTCNLCDKQCSND